MAAPSLAIKISSANNSDGVLIKVQSKVNLNIMHGFFAFVYVFLSPMTFLNSGIHLFLMIPAITAHILATIFISKFATRAFSGVLQFKEKERLLCVESGFNEGKKKSRMLRYKTKQIMVEEGSIWFLDCVTLKTNVAVASTHKQFQKSQAYRLFLIPFKATQMTDIQDDLEDHQRALDEQVFKRASKATKPEGSILFMESMQAELLTDLAREICTASKTEMVDLATRSSAIQTEDDDSGFLAKSLRKRNRRNPLRDPEKWRSIKSLSLTQKGGSTAFFIKNQELWLQVTVICFLALFSLFINLLFPFESVTISAHILFVAVILLMFHDTCLTLHQDKIVREDRLFTFIPIARKSIPWSDVRDIYLNPNGAIYTMTFRGHEDRKLVVNITNSEISEWILRYVWNWVIENRS